jgi:hypothetical protein
VNLAGFRARFPEFKTALDPLVQSVLDAAALETNVEELGNAFDEAHGLLAAHKLAISPFGQSARMVNKDGMTTYESERKAVMTRAIVTLRVS